MDEARYRLVFDLATQTSDPWTGFWTLLAVGTVALLLFAFCAYRIVRGFLHRSPASREIWFLSVFTGLVAAALLFGFFHQSARERGFREAVRTGPLRVAEGCLDYFSPGDSGAGRISTLNERWSVAGHHLEYGHGDMGSAFHQVEPLGGPVHADSRVRVAYVPDAYTGLTQIVRLEVQDGACPHAPYAPR